MAAPQTTFETSGTWTSVADGNTFLQTVATETGAILEIIGQSHSGVDLYAITVGTGSSMLLCTGAVHGNEPAGREMLLIKARDLAYSEDAGILSYLSTHKVVFIPTVNPDGFTLGTRNNAQDVDINRDAYTLISPEQRAIARYINQRKPHIVYDGHERWGTNNDIDIFPHMRINENACDVVRDYEEALSDYVSTYLTSQGLDPGEYPSNLISQNGTLSPAGLMGSVGIVVETYVESHTPTQRVTNHGLAFDAVRMWHNTNSADLADDLFQSRSMPTKYTLHTESEYYLQSTSVKIDTPDAYVLDEAEDFSAWIDVYNIKIIDGVIPVYQEAARMIPTLLDTVSYNNSLDTERFYGKKYGKRNGHWDPVSSIHGKADGYWKKVISTRRF